ncbi:DNA-directed RNA polymerase II subunit rpb7 [Diplonema papillatum]|nr:DNA-directed RNA polymerase II subunit rpb7 [Diplonema papillatum]
MFFRTRLTHYVHVDPCHFHEELTKIVMYQLCKEVEGTIDEEHGFIVAVDTSEGAIDIGPGILLDVGPSSFRVNYWAIVLRPFKDEVVTAIVTKVASIGLFCSLGPLEIFVSSKSSMPSDYVFNDSNPQKPKYVAEGEDTITVDDQVRLLVKGVQITNTEVKAVGDMCENYMGKMSAG